MDEDCGKSTPRRENCDRMVNCKIYMGGLCMRLYPLKLKAPLKDYLWGGTKLKESYGKQTELDKVAESWELSCHKDGQSIIINGEAAGMALSEYIEAQGPEILGDNAKRFPYFPLLIKLIDARDNLSVQVHPDDEYALRVEGEFGKTEMWYIVDCDPGASLLYGFKHEISQEEFRRRIADNTLLDVCNRVPVKKGDVFFIDAGTLHAIGKGILIAEIQQNSNTTYRIYDYGRVGKDGQPRELHVDKAIDVTRLAPPTKEAAPAAKLQIFADYQLQVLAQCDFFKVCHFNLQGECRLMSGRDSFQAILVLEGEVVLLHENEKIKIQRGECVFIPAGMGVYSLSGQGEYILSQV